MLQEFMQIAQSQYSKELMDSQVKLGIARGKLQQAADLMPIGVFRDDTLRTIEDITRFMARQAQIINSQNNE